MFPATAGLWACSAVSLCLVLVLVPIQVVGGTLMVRLSFIITAVFFAVSFHPDVPQCQTDQRT